MNALYLMIKGAGGFFAGAALKKYHHRFNHKVTVAQFEKQGPDRQVIRTRAGNLQQAEHSNH